MKYLFLILFSFSAYSQTAFFPMGKDGANLNYTFKEDCEKAEGQECFDVYSCPIDECILIDEVHEDTGIYTGKKLLRASPVRKAAKEAKIKEALEAEVSLHEKRKAAKEKVKGFEFKGKTIAELRAELNSFANDLKESQD